MRKKTFKILLCDCGLIGTAVLGTRWHENPSDIILLNFKITSVTALD